MATNWTLVLIKCRHEPRILLILLALLRLGLCYWPQTGYLHPDEFFQSPDIVGGRFFGSKIDPVWEFKSDKPIRSMLLPNLINGAAFKVATLFNSKPSAYALLVAPRLAYTLLSFIVDLSLYNLCRYYSSRGLWYLPVSLIFQSSFVCLACLTRTLSNTLEVVIFSLLLVVVCKSVRPRFRILFFTPAGSVPVRERVKPSKQLVGSMVVGFLVVLGTFNRPTFPAFAVVPLIYWTLENLKRNSYEPKLFARNALTPLFLVMLLTAFLLSAYDTVYYKNLNVVGDILNLATRFQFKELVSAMKEHWVLTPYNFVLYNTDVNNLTKYGLHMPFTHMLLNLPFIFSLLSLMFYGKLLSLLVDSGLYRLLFNSHRIYAVMLLSTLASIILLSFVPHQEFRFLLPLIIPLVYSFAFNIYIRNKLLFTWLLYNAALLYFYSSIHQSGVARAILDLDSILKSHQASTGPLRVNVLAFRCYLVPSYQWNIPHSDDRFHFDLQDTVDDFSSSIEMRLQNLLLPAQPAVNRTAEEESTRHETYIMLHTLYLSKLANVTEFQLLKQYNMHFSGEELQLALSTVKQYGWSKLREAFGFSLVRLVANHDEQHN